MVTMGGQKGCDTEQNRARWGIAITSYVNLHTLMMDTSFGDHWLRVLLMVHLTLPQLGYCKKGGGWRS